MEPTYDGVAFWIAVAGLTAGGLVLILFALLGLERMTDGDWTAGEDQER